MAMQIVDETQLNYNSPDPLQKDEVEWKEEYSGRLYDGTTVSARLMYEIS